MIYPFPESAFLKVLKPHLNEYSPRLPLTPSDEELIIFGALIKKIQSEPFADSFISDIASDLGLDETQVKNLIDKMWEANKIQRYNQLMGAVVHSRIPVDQMEKLMQSTGKQKKEIEPVMRLKFIQMMGLMNQSVMASYTGEIVPTAFMDFEHPLDSSYSHNAPPAGIDATFQFTPDLRSLTYIAEWKFQSAPSQLELEGRSDPFLKTATESARGISRFSLSDISSSKPPTNQQLTELNISWKSPVGYASHLSGLMNPERLKVAYHKRFIGMKRFPWSQIVLSSETGVEGVNNLIDQVYLNFKQWSNANSTGNKEVMDEAKTLIEQLTEISTEIQESDGKVLVMKHLDEVIGKILTVEEQKLDNLLQPLIYNPGRGNISLHESCRVLTENDCQYLTSKRAAELEQKIEDTVHAFTIWQEGVPGEVDTSTKKEQLKSILISLQLNLTATSIEDMDTPDPSHIESLKQTLDSAFEKLAD